MSQPTQTGTGIAGATGIASGLSDQGGKEVAAIIAVALLVIGGGELLLRLFEVPRYILPTPSAIASVFFSHEIATICEHYSYTLIELFARKSTTRIASPIAASAAATVKMKKTKTCPAGSPR